MTIGATNENWRGLVRKHLSRKTVCFVISLGLILFGYTNVVSRTELVTYDVLRLQERINDTYGVPLKEEIVGPSDNLFNEVHLEIGNSTAPSLLPIRANIRYSSYRDVVANLSSDWTSEKAESQREVFRRRASVARAGCKFVEGIPGYFEVKNNRLLNNLRWVKKHNLIWCPIFKAASTTWVKNLLLLAGEKVLNKSFHGRVRELYPRPDNKEEEKQVLDSSMKMIIVRHPLDRLLSAYRDKMLRVKHACDPYIKLQKDIIEKYEDPNGDPLPKSTVLMHVGLDGTQCLNEALGLNLTVPYGAGNPLLEVQPTNMTFTHPTFSQFLLKVRDDIARFWDTKGNSGLNFHWRPYWITCGPCKLNYDVIAHVETLGPDQEFVIRKLGLQSILYNTRAHASNFDSYNDTSNALAHYYRQVPKKVLRQIVKYYKPDFEIFGYDHKSFFLLAEGKTNQDKMLRVKHACDPYIKLQKDIIEKYEDPNGDPLPKSTVLMHVGLDGTQCLNEALGLNLTVPYGAGNPLLEVQPTNMTFTHPTFSQFLLKVRDDIARFWDTKGNSGLNFHWRPYWITCGPCKLNYDVIAHVETLGPDQEFVIRKLGLQSILYNTRAHASNFDSYNDTSNALAHYYRQVPKKVLRQIVKYYKPDFEIFGYDHKSFFLLAEGKTNQ